MTEVVLLVIGIIAFVASFVIPERKRALKEEDRSLGEAQIKELVDAQMQDAKERVSDMVDETITYAVEKTERSMERLTNEKIMAMNEYSDTVLGTIHKSHEEAVFLYDMLSNKQENLQEAVNQAELQAKKAKAGTAKRGTAKRKTAKTESDVPGSERPESVQEKPDDKKTPEIALSFAQAGDGGRNNNEAILALHREGKSNMAIARELGLGIGEVKLVIDLYKGM